MQLTESAAFTFRNIFTSHCIDKLTLTTSLGTTYVYGYKDSTTLFVLYDYDRWEILNYNILTKDGLLNVSGLHSEVSLYKNSDAHVSYELYYEPPFDVMPQLTHIFVKSAVELQEDRYKLGNNLWLKITEDEEDDEVSYVIYKDDQVLSGFRDPIADYQLGDGDTFVYIGSDNSVVIENRGDVSSLIIIRGVFTE